MVKSKIMLPVEITKDVINRLKSIGGQTEGLVRMLEKDEDPEKILTQFKAVQSAMDKTYYLLLDEVYRKVLAIKIVEAINACPGNCGNEDKIELIRQQFPDFTPDELTAKMKEITNYKKKIDRYNEENKKSCE